MAWCQNDEMQNLAAQPDSPTRIIVIGAGAWGTPAALQLQDRGFAVTLIERFDAGSVFASSGGSSRLWRLADTEPWRARMLAGTVGAFERLGKRVGTPVFRHTGMLWRDDLSLPAARESIAAIGIAHTEVPADHVGDFIPGLRPDGRDAIFVPDAGVVHADVLISRALAAFTAAGGTYLPQTEVVGVSTANGLATVALASGDALDAEQVLVTAGPGSGPILRTLGLDISLTPYLEQVVYFGDPLQRPPAPDLPALFDGPTDSVPGIYAMPSGDAGYKVGLDTPLRPLSGGTLGDDLDRAEVPERTELIRARVERDLARVSPLVLNTQVCTWTDSADGDYVIGRVRPEVTIACGDSGEGFKVSALLGELLADLVTGVPVDDELAGRWSPTRFTAELPAKSGPSAMGRH